MGYFLFIVNLLFSLYYLLIIVRMFLSWFPESRFQKNFRFVYRLTDPLLSVIRLGLPPEKIGVDASPFVAIIFLWVLQRVIIGILGG
jgi:YggT family protein